MYKRTEFGEFLLALALLFFGAFWGRVFFVLPHKIPVKEVANPAPDRLVDDSKISQKILGYWIVPLTEHWDPQNANLRTVEKFDVGGKGDIYLYANSQCRKIVQDFPFTWRIKGGELEYQVQGGRSSRDKIAHLDSDSLILLPDDGGETSRVRGVSCARPENF